MVRVYQPVRELLGGCAGHRGARGVPRTRPSDGPPIGKQPGGVLAPVDGGEPSAAWYPDPMGRHELRWHDGAAWTGRVSDAGEVGIDPLPPAWHSTGSPRTAARRQSFCARDRSCADAPDRAICDARRSPQQIAVRSRQPLIWPRRRSATILAAFGPQFCRR